MFENENDRKVHIGFHFPNENDRKVHIGYYLPKVEVKEYSATIDGKNIFDHPVKSSLRAYDNI